MCETDSSSRVAWSGHSKVEGKKGGRASQDSASVAGPRCGSERLGRPGLVMPLAPEDWTEWEHLQQGQKVLFVRTSQVPSSGPRGLASGADYINDSISYSVKYYSAVGINGTFLVTQIVENLPAVQETQVQSLCQEDPLKKGMATHTHTLAWRSPGTEKPGGLHSP